MNAFHYLSGVILLTMGRRVFWLFIACVGFAAGFNFGQQVLAQHSQVFILTVALCAGVAGALLAIFFQQLAIALAGFAAGGYIAITLLLLFGLGPDRLFWLAYFIGGVTGGLLLFVVFDWALIILSSFMGAAIIVRTTPLNPQLEILFFLILVIAGLMFQKSYLHVNKRYLNR